MEDEQRNLDEIDKVKLERLSVVLSRYSMEAGFELTEKISKEEQKFSHAIDFAKTFTRCFREFRNKFKYCEDAHRVILDLDIIFSTLMAWLMEYSGGYELGDHIALERIKKVVQDRYFDIDDFLKLYIEVKDG